MAFLWIFAAQDAGYGDSNIDRKCHGCNWFINNKLQSAKDVPKSWLKTARNPYPYLLSFGSIISLAWFVTGMIGLRAHTPFGYKLVFFFYK